MEGSYISHSESAFGQAKQGQTMAEKIPRVLAIEAPD